MLVILRLKSGHVKNISAVETQFLQGGPVADRFVL